VTDLKRGESTEWGATVPESVVDYRTVTASIVIAIVARLVGDDFVKTRHACWMSLNDPSWLERVAGLVDEILSSGGFIELWKVVGTVVNVHAAADHVNIDPQNALDYSRLIGWRYGSYGVLPKLLVEWKLDEESLGLLCVDQIWAKAVVRADGSIQTAETPFITTEFDEAASTGRFGSGTVVGSDAYIGPPSIGFAQDDLYLNIERHARSESPDMGLCGRVNGDSVGFVSVTEALSVLAHSLAAQKQCPGHSQKLEAYNVRTRAWCRPHLRKPAAKGSVTLISVKDHSL